MVDARVAHTPMSGTCDALIVGGGHNGLCGLSRRGGIEGGRARAASRRGWRGGDGRIPSRVSQFGGVIHGIAAQPEGDPRPRAPEARAAGRGTSPLELPADRRRALSRHGGGRTRAEVAKFSPRDADQLDAYAARLDVIADLLRDVVLETPPNVVEGSWRTALPELLSAARLGGKLRKLDMPLRRNCSHCSRPLPATISMAGSRARRSRPCTGSTASWATTASPYTPGSAYVLLHHVFGEVNGNKGAWGHAIGGMGAITQAMARSAASRGVEIHVDSPVREIIVEGGRAVGAVTENGKTFRASAVVSNLNPKLLYEKLVDPGRCLGSFSIRSRAGGVGSNT